MVTPVITTSVTGQPAAAQALVTLSPALRAPAAPVQAQKWLQYYAGVNVAPYVIIDGIPQEVPLGIAAASSLSVGKHDVVEGRTPPELLDLDATDRWIATGYDTLSGNWTALVGTEVLAAQSGTLPEGLDTGYSYVIDDDEIVVPAVVLDAGEMLSGGTPRWEADAVTVAIVAVLHPVPNDFGVVLRLPSTDPLPGLRVRYYPGQVQLWSDVLLSSHRVARPVAQPVVIVVSVDQSTGLFHVTDSDRNSDSFDATSALPPSFSLEIGNDTTHSSPIDVLDVALWLGRALSVDEIEQVVAEYDHAYGVMP